MKLHEHYAAKAGLDLKAHGWEYHVARYMLKNGADPFPLLDSITIILGTSDKARSIMCALHVVHAAFDELHVSDYPYFALVKNIFVAGSDLFPEKSNYFKNYRVIFAKSLMPFDKDRRDKQFTSLLASIEGSRANIIGYAWLYNNFEPLLYDSFNDRVAERLESLFVAMENLPDNRRLNFHATAMKLLYHHNLKPEMSGLRQLLTGTDRIQDREVFYRCLANYKFEQKVEVPEITDAFLKKYSVILASEIVKLSHMYSVKNRVKDITSITNYLMSKGLDFTAALLLDDDHVNNVAMFNDDAYVRGNQIDVIREMLTRIDYFSINAQSIQKIVATEVLRNCEVGDLDIILATDRRREHYYTFSNDTRILGRFENKKMIKRIASSDFGL